jgi:hypothetical protein
MAVAHANRDGALPARAARAVRVAQWAEGLYALVALYFAMGVRGPPTAASAVSWVHWLGTAIVAGLLCWRLRRPNRAILGVAAILSVYILGNSLWAAPRLAAVVQASAGPVAAVALALAALIWGTQAVVLVSVVLARRGGAGGASA